MTTIETLGDQIARDLLMHPVLHRQGDGLLLLPCGEGTDELTQEGAKHGTLWKHSELAERISRHVRRYLADELERLSEGVRQGGQLGHPPRGATPPTLGSSKNPP